MVNTMYEEYQLQPSPKGYNEDQDKTILPEDTYKNTFAALQKAFPNNTFTLTELKSTEFYSVYDFDDGLLGSHGKGASNHQSKASAIMEYAERKSWYEYDFSKAKGFIKASYNELKDKIDMSIYEDIFKIHYFNDKEKTQELLRTIPMYWIEAYNLTKKEPVLYPVTFNDLLKSSNGLAAGNTKEEALTQGLCELIEREHIDNFILDAYNAKTRIIDHSTLKNPYLLNLLKWAKMNDINVYFLDISNTVPITTILTHCVDNNPPVEYARTGEGYGTHNDPEKAMIRALTEYLQGREIYITDLPKEFNLKVGNWQTHLNLDFTRVINNAKTISVKECYHVNHDDFKKDAEKIIELLKQRGHDVVALSLTHKELKVPVYRLLIPKFKTGDEFSPFARNQHYIISFLLKIAKLDDQAWEYYQKHKHKITTINSESLELIKQINKITNYGLNAEDTQRSLLHDDVLYKIMMPRNHMATFKFSSYVKRNILAAIEVLGGVIINKPEANTTNTPEQELTTVQD